MSVHAVAAGPATSGPHWPPAQSPATLSPPAPRGFQAAPGFSQAGAVFSRLAALQLADPEKLKLTATEIAQALRAEADKQPAGPSQALAKVAQAFDRVAESGSLMALEPPREPSGPRPYARPQGPAGAEPQALAQAMGLVAAKLGVQ